MRLGVLSIFLLAVGTPMWRCCSLRVPLTPRSLKCDIGFTTFFCGAATSGLLWSWHDDERRWRHNATLPSPTIDRNLGYPASEYGPGGRAANFEHSCAAANTSWRGWNSYGDSVELQFVAQGFGGYRLQGDFAPLERMWLVGGRTNTSGTLESVPHGDNGNQSEWKRLEGGIGEPHVCYEDDSSRQGAAYSCEKSRGAPAYADLLGSWLHRRFERPFGPSGI